MEVEILVAEVGADPAADQLFHILYDGTVIDEDRSACSAATPRPSPSASRPTRADGIRPRRRALRLAVAALAGPERTLQAADLEVALIDRSRHGPLLPPPRATTTSRPCSRPPSRPGRRPAETSGNGSAIP